MKRFHFFSRSIIGLDIQNHALRLVQLRKNSKSFLIEKAVTTALTPDIFAEGKVRCWDSLSAILSELVKKFRLAGKIAAINLPASLVNMQHIQVPKGLPSAGIEAEIHSHLEKVFPDLTESLYVDFVLSPAKEPGYLQVFFVASRQEYLSKLITCINQSGLHLKIIDIDIYAIKRIFDYSLSHLDMKNKVNAILCIHDEIAFFIIHETQEIIFYQQWELSDAIDFMLQFKNKIQSFYIAHPNKIIQNILVSNLQYDIKSLVAELNSGRDFIIHYPDPLFRLRVSQSFKKNNNENFSHYVLACGTAMREIPRW